MVCWHFFWCLWFKTSWFPSCWLLLLCYQPFPHLKSVSASPLGQWQQALCCWQKPFVGWNILDDWQVLILQSAHASEFIFLSFLFFNLLNNFSSLGCYRSTDMKWPRLFLLLSVVTPKKIRLVCVWLATDWSTAESHLLSKRSWWLCRGVGLRLGLSPYVLPSLPPGVPFLEWAPSLEALLASAVAVRGTHLWCLSAPDSSLPSPYTVFLHLSWF